MCRVECRGQAPSDHDVDKMILSIYISFNQSILYAQSCTAWEMKLPWSFIQFPIVSRRVFWLTVSCQQSGSVSLRMPQRRVRPQWSMSPLALSGNAANLLIAWGLPLVLLLGRSGDSGVNTSIHSLWWWWGLPSRVMRNLIQDSKYNKFINADANPIKESHHACKSTLLTGELHTLSGSIRSTTLPRASQLQMPIVSGSWIHKANDVILAPISVLWISMIDSCLWTCAHIMNIILINPVTVSAQYA